MTGGPSTSNGMETEGSLDEARAVTALMDELAPDGEFPKEWLRSFAASGFAAPHWPRPWGRDASAADQIQIDEALRSRNAPRPMNPIGIGWAGPTLLVAGTPEQHEKWLPGILDGSELWCQLFSEPGAGSDLASLGTTASRDGDEFIVNGQKVWTTLGHVARWGILLARTDSEASNQSGITYFILDMQSPGVEVRPLVQMTGTHEFNEVFFTDVRVPVSNVVGEINDGWRLAKVTLGNERVSLSGEGALWGRGPTAGDLIEIVRKSGGSSDPQMRQRIAALHIESEVLRYIRLRSIAAVLRGLEPGPEASIRKAIADEHGQHIMALALELAGTNGMLSWAGPCGATDPVWHYGFLYSPALTIGGGTSEVQRTILGERVLGLPREP